MSYSVRLGCMRAGAPILAAACVISSWSCGGGNGSAVDDSAGNHTSELVNAAPAKSGIEHVVVLMMENRSFDHLLGWAPGADGKQAGLAYPDPSGALIPTHPLAPDYQGCAH